MSFGSSGSSGPSRNERREAAREKAKTLLDDRKKKEKRSKLYLQGGVVIVVLAIAAVVVFAITSTIRPAAAGPLNMASDGILIGEGYVAASTNALQPGDEPIANERDESSGVISITTYIDYFCPFCGAFEEANGDQIAKWVNSGAATIEIHPLAILDSVSLGSKYSTRAANSAACVANYSPNQYFDYNALLFANQPEENTSGLSDDELIALTTQADVKSATSIASCITNGKFTSWVSAAKTRALTGPIEGTTLDAITQTPTVLVNGEKYTGAPGDAKAFAAFVTQAAGASFNENSTSTATPTPTPAP